MSYKTSPEVYAFAGAGLCSLMLAAALGLATAEWIVRHATYWILLFSVAAFIYSVYRAMLEQGAGFSEWAQAFSGRRYVLLLTLVVAALYLLQPSGYKVVMDEPLLVASSRQMHLEKELYVPKSCYELGGAFYNFDGYVDKRPGFFPFLLSLLHDFTGYRSSQGFVLNAMLAPLLVLFVATLSARLWPNYGKYLGPLLVLTVPLFSIVANGSGFDLLNSVLLLLILLLALQFNEQPGRWAGSALIWASVLAAHTRYESVLYLVAVFLIILLRSYSEKRSFFHWTICFVPFALLPVALLFRVIGGQDDPLQLRDNASAAFSFEYFGQNLKSAADFFFHFGSEQPNGWFLSALSVVALCAGAFLLIKGARKSARAGHSPLWPVYGLLGLGLLAYAGTVFFYHWGQLDDPAASRFALPIILAQILIVIAVCGRLPASKTLAWVLGLSCLACFSVLTLPTALKTHYLETYPAAKWAQWQKAKALQYQDENVLFITQQRLVPVLEEVSAISIGKALGAKEKIAFHHQLGTFNKILFVQLYFPGQNGDLIPAIPLGSDFTLNELERHSIGRGRVVVLSELQVVRLSPAEKRRLDAMDYRDFNLSMDWFHIIPDTLP